MELRFINIILLSSLLYIYTGISLKPCCSVIPLQLAALAYQRRRFVRSLPDSDQVDVVLGEWFLYKFNKSRFDLMFAGNVNIVLRMYVIFFGFYLYKLLFADLFSGDYDYTVCTVINVNIAFPGHFLFYFFNL